MLGRLNHGRVLSRWRRKVALATLMIACLFTAGWVRSFVVDDFLCASAGTQLIGSKHYFHFWHFVSADGTLFVGKIWSQSSDATDIQDIENYYRYPRWSTSYDADFPDGDLKFKWRLCGFGVYERCPGDPYNGGMRLLIPYWSVVLLLTLISTFLFLSKPRKWNEAKITELAAVEGASITTMPRV